jgi:wyosine [tRNA(Phe)-imidazoG37] synthetase (radical SAM superfamily)
LAVLTNGSLLSDKKVQKALMPADLVIPSLDAGDSETFGYVNRPLSKLTFKNMVKGIADFREKYKGRFWLEVFLLGGISTIEDNIFKLKRKIQLINPEKIQLNTLYRPSSESYTHPVDQEHIQEIADYLGGNVDILTEFNQNKKLKTNESSLKDVIGLIERRPCTFDDLVNGLGVAWYEAAQYIKQLQRKHIICVVEDRNRIFYTKC